jgi:hypothetical protein
MLSHSCIVCCGLAFLCFYFSFNDDEASVVDSIVVFSDATDGTVFGVMFTCPLLVTARDEALVFVG